MQGYREGYEVLKEIIGIEDATFSTFCFWLWDEDVDTDLNLGDNWLEMKEKTIPTSFGKDYKYQVELKGEFMGKEIDIFVGNFSRHNVGMGYYLQTCVEQLAWHLGRHKNDTLCGLAILLHIYDNID